VVAAETAVVAVEQEGSAPAQDLALPLALNTQLQLAAVATAQRQTQFVEAADQIAPLVLSHLLEAVALDQTLRALEMV
jgi:hypothetical protein